VQKESWGCSKLIERCQKYTIHRYLLLAGMSTPTQSYKEQTTLQIINGNCSIQSGEFNDTELKSGDVIQIVPNKEFKLRGHSRNDATILVTYQKMAPVFNDEEDD